MTEIKKPYSDISDVFDLFPLLYGDVTEQQKNRYRALFDNFKKRFDCTGVYVASSSGRVEICGNHTDHNGGKVVSCAISLDSLAMFMPNSDKVIRIVSEGYGDIVVDLNGDEK